MPRKAVVLAGWESVLILFALLTATVAYFLDFREVGDYLGRAANWFRLGLVVGVCQLAQWYGDAYDPRCMGSRSTQSARTIRSLGAATLALALLYGAFPAVRLAPGIAVFASFLTLPLLLLSRISLFSAVKAEPLESVLILGTGQSGINLAREILLRPELQYRVVGFLDENGENFGRPLASPGIIGGLSQVREIVASESVDRVVISLAERRGVMPIRDLTALRIQGVPIEDAHSIYERITGRIMLETLRPSWLILSDGFRKSLLLLAAKRMIDVMVSFILIVLTAPVMLVTAVAILLETGRPILFRQERVGLGGRVFRILKFRSMRQDSGKTQPSWTADGDPRVTRLGNFIRKYRIDELPQLFNVLRGEMSLIGPRPEVPYFCELLEREIPFFNQRHCVRPGISGWAQVKYKYGASLEEAKTKFEYDLFYIKHLSVLLDLTIIVETVKVVLLGKGAK